MISQTELIVNADHSIFHLHLHPEQLASTVFLVGDPGRVAKVSARFDAVEERVSNREFNTHTGRIGNKRVTVISTGIGTDNIDIVINELDALVNMDFDTKIPKTDIKKLTLIRLGTSGSLQRDIAPDSLVCSSFGLGFDNLLHYYQDENNPNDAMNKSLQLFLQEQQLPVKAYLRTADKGLINHFGSAIQQGITITAPGFYGPQGRTLRIKPWKENFLENLSHFEWEGHRITNLEMETSAIYGLSKLLGHKALSLNAILANRAEGKFSANPAAAVENLIDYAIEKITDLV